MLAMAQEIPWITSPELCPWWNRTRNRTFGTMMTLGYIEPVNFLGPTQHANFKVEIEWWVCDIEILAASKVLAPGRQTRRSKQDLPRTETNNKTPMTISPRQRCPWCSAWTPRIVLTDGWLWGTSLSPQCLGGTVSNGRCPEES
jgi:hypothetical protein